MFDAIEGKTALVIAHRLSTIVHLDRILVFDGGKIIEDGSHAELMKQ
jgi:ATP-binding cassette subfamily B protein